MKEPWWVHGHASRRKTLQCKDILATPVLRGLETHYNPYGYSGWMFLGMGEPDDLMPYFPPETPYKLARAKLVQLRRMGLVDGCGCGCRGDWTITPMGIEFLHDPQYRSMAWPTVR